MSWPTWGRWSYVQGCSTVGCSHQMWNPHFNLGYALATAGENGVLTKQLLQNWEQPLPYGVEPIWSRPCVHVSSSALDCFGTWVKQIDRSKPWNFVYFQLLLSFNYSDLLSFERLCAQAQGSFQRRTLSGSVVFAGPMIKQALQWLVKLRHSVHLCISSFHIASKFWLLNHNHWTRIEITYKTQNKHHTNIAWHDR